MGLLVSAECAPGSTNEGHKRRALMKQGFMRWLVLLVGLLAVSRLASAPAESRAAASVQSTVAIPLSASELAPIGNLPIYGDALATGWQNWSWGAQINLANSSPIHT